MPFTLPSPTEADLTAWITENIGAEIRDEDAVARELLTAFDFASKTSTSLNNPHRIVQAIDEARDPDRIALTWPPVPAAEAAAMLLEQFRITRKPADHGRLFVDLPMPVVVSRHQCPFCRRYTRADQAQVRDHMTRCWQNPVLRCCKTCVHHQDGSHPEDDESCTNPAGPEWEEYRFPVLHCPLWQAREA